MKTILFVLCSFILLSAQPIESYTISNDSIVYTLFANGPIESQDSKILFGGGISVTGMQEDQIRGLIVFPPSRLEDSRPGPYHVDASDPRIKIYKADIDATPNSSERVDWTNAVALGAPFLDLDNDGLYSYKHDHPIVYGDHQTWMVYRDVDFYRRSAKPLEMEVQQLNWVYNFGKLLNVLFFKYTIISKSDVSIDSTLISVILDADIGHYGDDLIGCDTLLNLGYTFNYLHDSYWGQNPPSLGCIIISNDHQQLFSFNSYGSNWLHIAPDVTIRFFQQGQDAHGNHIDPSALGRGGSPNLKPFYLFSGNPVNNDGWLDDRPGDKRLIITINANSLAPGERYEFYTALVLGRGNSPLNSVSVMKENAAKALQAIRAGFKRADPPPAATLEAVPGDKSVDLMIDLSDCYDYEEEDVLGNRYLFEGFALYQLAHADAEAGDPEQSRLIARYDIDNIYKDIYRQNDAGISERVWDGQNNLSGLSAESNIVIHTVNADAFSGKPINNFSRYYFAVRTFSLNYTALQPFNQTDEIEDDWYAPRSFDIQFSPVANQVPVLAGEDTEAVLDRVQAVPNPYFPGQGYNGAVRFIHLPQGAVIRIFDVAGRLVRSMAHTLEQPFWDWDLRNDAGNRIAGGIYLIHVSKSASGSRILKLAVVSEKK